MTDITTGPGEPEAASTTAADLEASNAAVGAVSTAEQLRYIHQQAADARAVSYTHLTLPTICSV